METGIRREDEFGRPYREHWQCGNEQQIEQLAHIVVKNRGHWQSNRFFGYVQLDPTRISRDVGAIANEVIQHLASLVGAEVKVTVEIQARVPAGVPESVVRIVSENCRTLKFTSHGFEREQ